MKKGKKKEEKNDRKKKVTEELEPTILFQLNYNEDIASL